MKRRCHAANPELVVGTNSAKRGQPEEDKGGRRRRWFVEWGGRSCIPITRVHHAEMARGSHHCSRTQAKIGKRLSCANPKKLKLPNNLCI